MGAFEIGYEILVFVEEDGTAAEIEGIPEQGLVGEAENEEIAGGRAAVKSRGY